MLTLLCSSKLLAARDEQGHLPSQFSVPDQGLADVNK